ncbi:MAG: PHP domain-containing protein [Chloroflexi bacterium]|nr:PHP domain-containing protein [Chloroflexota bacterium]
MLHADLHIHTLHSWDCAMGSKAIVRRCLKIGINCIAVTDHNAIAGALELKRVAPFPVIVGEEIRSQEGEIIGFFLKESIPRGLSPQDTARRIKDQGGLVCIPHPFDRLRRSALKRTALEDLLPFIDILEVFNSRTTLLGDSRQAELWARSHDLLFSAGSDAHSLGEIGSSYLEIPDFDRAEEFAQALAQAKVVGHRSPPWVHLLSMWAKLSKNKAKVNV